jgi:tripartite-type tricarboxylate transporter receptor subunit TctC
MKLATAARLGSTLLSLLLLALPQAQAQSGNWPDKPVKIINPFPAGGASDTLARIMADELQKRLGQNFVVENRTGAGGNIGMESGAKSAPDGSTLLMTPSTFFSVYPHSYSKLPYTTKDFEPVSLLAYTNFGLAVGPQVPESVKTFKDFVAWSKVNPDKATYGSPAPGSVPHLIVAAASQHFGVPLRHVPYRGSVPGIQDLRGGQIAAMSSPIGALLPHIVPGGVRVLAVTGSGRSTLLPQVPTYQEQGLPIIGREWFGLFLPAGVRPELLARANTAVRQALQQPDLIDAATKLGLEVAGSSGAELQELIRQDSKEWEVWVKRLGFTAES